MSKPKMDPVVPRIVAAVGTAVHSGENPDLAARIEAAQVAAIEAALAEGVSLENSAEILRRKNAARDRVLADG
jgi:hypothetical protein